VRKSYQTTGLYKVIRRNKPHEQYLQILRSADRGQDLTPSLCNRQAHAIHSRVGLPGRSEKSGTHQTISKARLSPFECLGSGEKKNDAPSWYSSSNCQTISKCCHKFRKV
jgi:hypothetical protein